MRGTRPLQCMVALATWHLPSETWRLALATWHPYRFAPLPMTHRRGHMAHGSGTVERGAQARGTVR